MEPISSLILLGVACLIFRNKHKTYKEEKGDSYIILSELGQDQGRHDEDNDDGTSIYDDGDGDHGW